MRQENNFQQLAKALRNEAGHMVVFNLKEMIEIEKAHVSYSFANHYILSLRHESVCTSARARMQKSLRTQASSLELQL